jgi:hypothetical protein
LAAREEIVQFRAGELDEMPKTSDAPIVWLIAGLQNARQSPVPPAGSRRVAEGQNVDATACRMVGESCEVVAMRCTALVVDWRVASPLALLLWP